MSGQAELLRAALYPECHEGVTRSGEFGPEYQPCEGYAVALRRDMGEGGGAPYPVCRKHIRWPMVRLDEIAAAYLGESA